MSKNKNATTIGVWPRILCRVGWHTWTKWKIIQVKKWVSFFPEYYNDTTSYGMYLQSTTDYKGPAGQFITVERQEKQCLICGKTKRDFLGE